MYYHILFMVTSIFFFFLMIRRPPRSTRTDTSFPTRRSSDLAARASTWWEEEWLKFPSVSKQPDGSWRYWCVPADSGVYQRSEEHTSELQSLMRISYAVFCLKKKKKNTQKKPC